MDKIVTAAVLGRWLRVTDRAVRDLADKGMVMKADRNRYDLEESMRRVIADLRRQALGRGGESIIVTQAAEHARLARENADHVALKNAKARGEIDFQFAFMLARRPLPKGYETRRDRGEEATGHPQC